MSENFDEVTTDATRAMRMALMLGSQAVEQMARLRAQQERHAADASRERAEQIREQLDVARDAAHRAYEPVADPRRFAQADPETIAAAWSSAAAWADVDPRAAAAEAALSEQTRRRFGVDPQELREHVQHQRDGAQGQAQAGTSDEREEGDRLTEAMDPQWRERATTDDLERRWHEANADLDRPGAQHARDALEATLAERMGVDLERFRQKSDPALTETAFHAAGDLAAAAADRAAEGSERAEAAGWENRASEEHGREAAADDPGLAIEESVDAREAEGMAVQANTEADVDHASANINESRADTESMQQAGVPARSQQVRTSTARGFGSTPNAGPQAKRRPKARKNTRTTGRTADRDLGR
ncbi:hypothetical protein [Janibacter terrae]|uniref:hypothetical protein n=1 Tax=Janibacter terrae TaxID=103817 RepID=UPI0031F7B17E